MVTNAAEPRGRLTPRSAMFSPGWVWRCCVLTWYLGEYKDLISTATWRKKFIITLSRQQEKKKKNKYVARRLGIDWKILADKKMF